MANVDVVAVTKRCTRCHVSKGTADFYRHPTTTDRLSTRCRDCIRVARRAAYRSTGELDDARRRNWARYGLTPEAYWSKNEAQGGRCAICDQAPPPGKLLVVDHCHATGQARDLLCPTCNVALGGARDSVDVLLACIEYLRRHAAAATAQAKNRRTQP